MLETNPLGELPSLSRADRDVALAGARLRPARTVFRLELLASSIAQLFDPATTPRLQVGRADFGTSDPFGSGVRVQAILATAAGPARLDLPLDGVRRLLAALLRVDAEAFAASDLLTRLEEGALAAIFDHLLRHRGWAPMIGPCSLSAIGCGAGLASDERAWGVSGDLEIAGEAFLFRLLIPEETVSCLVGSLRERLAGLGFDDLLISLAATVGSVTLLPAELSGVEAGDIVLIEAETLRWEDGAPAGTVTVRSRGIGAGPGFLGKLIDRGSRCEVESFLVGGDDPATESDGGEGSKKMSEAAGGEALVAGLPIKLRVEMGRIQITLAQLSELGPGAVLELHKDARGPVALWVEDRKIGEGELVSVDGQLGVRITALG